MVKLQPTPKPNVVHIPVYLALDRGFYKAEGLDVKISRFRGGTRAHQAITAKGTDLDLAWIPGPLTMSGIARGPAGFKVRPERRPVWRDTRNRRRYDSMKARFPHLIPGGNYDRGKTGVNRKP